MRQPNRRGEGGKLRDELVSAASDLLEELDGEEAMSMRAVARRAGVVPQSVYLHFPDKRALMVAVYASRFGDLVEALRAGAARHGSPSARLRAICHAYCAYAEEHPGHYRVLFGTAGTADWEPDEMVGMAAWEVLHDAVAAHAGGADPVATSCLWAGLHGMVTLRRDRPSFPWPPREKLIDGLIARAAAGGSSRRSSSGSPGVRRTGSS